MIGGITGLYGIYALSNVKRYSYNKTNNLYEANKSQTSNNLNKGKLDNSSYNFLKGYNSRYQNLYTSSEKLNNLNQTSVWNDLSSSSSNENAVSVSVNFSPKETSQYDIDIKQMAQTQQNISSELISNEMSTLGSGNITIKKDNTDFTLNYNADGKTNKQTLSDIAKGINSQISGLRANVIEKDEISYLEITSEQTGQNQSFSILASDNFISQTGINKVNKNAQDSVYTINKVGNNKDIETRKSSTNEINIDSYKVSGEINGIGKSTITIQTSKDDVKNQIKDLVTNYNDTVKFLNDNASKGTGVGKNLYNLLTAPISEKSMKSIGLEYKKNGTLSFDENKFNEAYDNDLSNVKNIIGGNYGIASGISENSINALREPSQNLLDNVNPRSPFVSNVANNKMNEIGMLGIYSKGGVYNVKNYGAIGMLLNTQV